MNPQLSLYVVLSLTAGVLIPVSAALSAAVGRQLGNPSIASLIVIAGTAATALAYTLLTGATRITPGALASIQPLQWLAGCGLAFYLIAITYVAPRFGVGNAIMLVVAAQIVSSAAIDQFGLLGAPQKPVDPLRLVGLGVMVLGVVIAQYAASAAKPQA